MASARGHLALNLHDYLNPSGCPKPIPDLAAMTPSTRSLHESIDEAIRRRGVPYLHPKDPTIQLDLLGSQRMIAWQEGKASFLFEGDGCWSSLPQVYARYGVVATHRLIERVREFESAKAAVVTDCGMQACALIFDILFRPGAHAVLLRQVYNKTRKYLEWLAARTGGSISIVADADYPALEAAIREDTTLVFAETYTNPLVRAVDPERLGELIVRARERLAPELRLIIDDTIASPWSLKRPFLLYPGVDFVVASGTKSLAGQDRDLWGYVASNRVDVMNDLMDLMAMRGGILDWRRAAVILDGLPVAQRNFDNRCDSASRVAQFLCRHPKVSEVFHPSLSSHPDREVIDRYYTRHGSLLSFRLRSADENQARHFADVLAMCVVPRYALSFDGLTTKVNHHLTVSEYFTPPEELLLAGIDRLIRLGIGLEHADDIVACLNWALWHHDTITPSEVKHWQANRARDLGIYDDAPSA